MALRSRTMMSDSGTKWNFSGVPIEAAGYYGITSGVHTVAISTQVFVGRIYLYGTLENTPQEADDNNGWFEIKPQNGSVNQSLFNFTGDGVTMQYTLGIPGNTNNVFLTYDGVTQNPIKDFTYTDGILYLTEVVQPNVQVAIRIMAPSYNADEFGKVVHREFSGDGITTEYKIEDDLEPVQGVTQNVFVNIDGVVQTPQLDYTFGDGILTFTTAPPLAENRDNIFITVYPPLDVSKQTDYFVQFPINASDPDQGNVIISPIYGPRTTTTIMGSFTGNYTYIKAELKRDYLEIYDPAFPEYKLNAVGAISRILVNF